MHRARIVGQIVEKHPAAGAGGEVMRQPDYRRIGIGRLEKRGQELAGDAAHRLADREVFGHRLQMAIGRLGVAEPERAEIPPRVLL